MVTDAYVATEPIVRRGDLPAAPRPTRRATGAAIRGGDDDGAEQTPPGPLPALRRTAPPARRALVRGLREASWTAVRRTV